MADRIYSLADLRQRCRETADLENASFQFDDSELDNMINEAVSDLWDACIEADTDSFVTSVDVTTTASQQTVAIDETSLGAGNTHANMYLLRGVDILIGDRYYPLRRFRLDERHRYQTNGRPVAYTFRPGIAYNSGVALASQLDLLRLYPTPDAAYSLRVWYVPHAPVLVTNPTPGTNTEMTSLRGINGWEEFVINTVAAKAMMKQQRDPSPFMMRREQVLQRVRSLGARDQSGMVSSVQDVSDPYYLDLADEDSWYPRS